MKKISLNKNWNFQYDMEGNLFNFDIDMSKGQNVNIPHDFIIGMERDPKVMGGARTGYFSGAAGVYTKYLKIGAEYKNKKVILELDGAFMNAIVVMNSDIVVKHPYGYTAFHADLTNYLRYGQTNKLSIYVNNCMLPNSRWYTGGGLYRDVHLLYAEQSYIKPWGVAVKTKTLSSKEALVTITTELENASNTAIYGQLELCIERNNNQIAKIQLPVRIGAQESVRYDSNMSVENPVLWDLDSPELYQLNAIFMVDDLEMDSHNTRFGIRTVTVDSKNGLQLNGRTIKLKGGCVHHDCGILGSAAHKDYEYRKVKIHKENGFNAIRCSHNPPSSHLLDACDKYGILVIDEAFDCWRMGKSLNDYSLFFEDWWQRDMTSMIMRDRNHPSVIMWSIGNEIGERSGDSDGYVWAERLAQYARELDPTRLITAGICAIWPTLEEAEESIDSSSPDVRREINLDTPFSKKYWGPLTEETARSLDVVGYNYLDGRYEEDGIKYPERVICGTESFAQKIDLVWELVEKFPYVIGDFAWTSYDYIGEAGIGKALYFKKDEPLPAHEIAHDSPYPWRLANDSDYDICGFETPQAAFRRIVWGSEETSIVIHNPEHYGKQEVMSLWGWPDCFKHFTCTGYEGNPVKVSVYSRGTEVELVHNGKSLGRKKVTRFQADFDFIYQAGELHAISYYEKGILSEATITSAGTPRKLEIVMEPAVLPAHERSMVFLVVKIVDDKGNLVPADDIIVEAEVIGDWELKAFGNANPKSKENYLSGTFTSYRGQFLAIASKKEIRNKSVEPTGMIKVYSDQLGEARLEL